MFDVEKVQRMTDELENFARAHKEIYLTFEVLSGETVALFHRLKINVRAIISDEPSKPIDYHDSFFRNPMHEKLLMRPVLKTSEAAKKFSEHTGIIAVVKKPLPFFRTELPFVVNRGQLLVPTFILSPEEISAIYERLTISQIAQRYAEDGVEGGNFPIKFLATKFAQGIKTFLDPKNQTFKFQFLSETQFDFRYELDDAAIVIQGPIVYENNYTAETLKLYRKIYPNVPIVISTWTGEATDDFRKTCKKNYVVLLDNVPPKFPGPYNINMQLESSFNGIKFIRENTNVKFVLKTRCDQRINKPDFLTYFRNLTLTFPPFGNKLRGRIILLEALKWLPFRTSDFLAFGYVEDISKLYGITHHRGENDAPVRRKNHSRLFMEIWKIISRNRTLHNYTPPSPTKKLRRFNNVTKHIHEIESHLLKKFYEENIAAIDYDKFLETGWKFMRDYLLIIGLRDINLDWPKYETFWQYEICPVDSGIAGEIDFARWLDLYRNFKPDWV